MLVKIKVRPASSKAGIERKSDEAFIVKTRAKAEAGKANNEALEIVGRYFGVPTSGLKIIRGLRSKNKMIEIKN
ncbi:MAG: DUF167 domain-containing protein [Patescibacteria group bacterium]|nr:DUF167 domain-containing protein [Patescibacteria group bacterium]